MDKRVPVAIIVTLLVQAGGALWFFAKMDARVYALEAARLEQRERDAQQDRNMTDTAGVIRIDLGYIRQQLDVLLRESHK